MQMVIAGIQPQPIKTANEFMVDEIVFNLRDDELFCLHVILLYDKHSISKQSVN